MEQKGHGLPNGDMTKKRDIKMKRNKILALVAVLTLSFSASIVAISNYDNDNVDGAVDETFSYAYEGSTLLYKITSENPNEVSVIGHGTLFVDLTIPESVEYLGEEYSVKSIGDGAFAFCMGLTTVNIGSVETIGVNAFYNCVSLETVNLNSVNTIGKGAFSYCLNLYTVDLRSVEILARDAFLGCEGLSTILINDDNAYFEVYDGILYDKGRTEVVLCPPALPITTYTALSTVTAIGDFAFRGCKNITTLDLGSAETIGVDAFLDCSDLTTVIMESVKNVGAGAFYDCTSLVVINMNSAETIGNNAFRRCTSLTTVNASSAETIGTDALYGCVNLEIIVLREGTDTSRADLPADAITIFSDPYIRINAMKVGDEIEMEIYAKEGYAVYGTPSAETDDGTIVQIDDIGNAWRFALPLPDDKKEIWITQPVSELYRCAVIISGSEGTVEYSLNGTDWNDLPSDGVINVLAISPEVMIKTKPNEGYGFEWSAGTPGTFENDVLSVTLTSSTTLTGTFFENADPSSDDDVDTSYWIWVFIGIIAIVVLLVCMMYASRP